MENPIDIENPIDNKFTWEIENFFSSQSETGYIYSDKFVIDGCEWCLVVNPQGDGYSDCFSLYLAVSDPASLPRGWGRNAKFAFTVVNQYWEQFSEVKVGHQWFSQRAIHGGFTHMLNFALLNDTNAGFMVNEKVKIVAEIDAVELITEQPPEELVDVNGFHVHPSRVDLVRLIFEKHPDLALGCSVPHQGLRSECMNVLLTVMYILSHRPDRITEDELSMTVTHLEYLTTAGFEVEWLQKKVDQIRVCKERLARYEEMKQQLNELEQKRYDLIEEMKKENTEIWKTTTPSYPFNDVLN